jgi:5-formyltetrahydrofolate cyclo-ligase
MMINVKKKSIRKNILARRNALTGEQIETMSKGICETFISLDEVRNCSTMMIFMSFGSEVNTDYIIERAWQWDKRVLVPLCKPETKKLVIFPIKTFNDVEPGYFGIREPKKDILKPASKAEVDLVVVPAVAFDRRGYRVGYGGGYYDRFLTSMNVPKIGLAFSCQIIPEAPTDRYDIPVDGIITEKEYIKTG